MKDKMDESVEGDIEKTFRVPFRFLTNGDGTDDNPGVRIKSRFILIPNGFQSDLDELIMKNGGDVMGDLASEADAEYAVTLLDDRYYLKNSTKNCDLPHDTFSSAFVGDAIECSRNSLPLPDLNEYRITPSKYSSYDANQVLLQQIKWSDLVPLAKPPSCKTTARKVIAGFEAANPSLKTHYQERRMTEKEATNEKNLPVTKAERSDGKKCTSDASTQSNGTTTEKILEDDELSSNRNNTTKSPAPVQRTQKPDIAKRTDDSTTRHEVASKTPETIQPPNVQSSAGPIHRSQRLPSTETEREDDLLAKESESAEQLLDPPEPRSDQTDQAVPIQLNRTLTPRKHKCDKDLVATEEEAGGESTDSPESLDSGTNQPTPVKLAPHPVLGETPPRVKRPNLVQKVFAGPACSKSGSKPKSPSHSKTDKSAAARGRHDGWLSEDDESSSGNENNNDGSDYSLSEGETNMFKRPKLVPKAFAGPPSHKSKKSGQKAHVSRSANSIAKAQIGFDNNDGWLSTDVSSNDIDDDNMSVSSTGSTGNTRKGPKLLFSRDEGQKMLDLVCEKKAFMYTKGNRLWQQMEEFGLFPGRTHQSLKEHWRKKVLPNALKNKLYQISPEQLSNLKKAQERMKWSQHANICPDFTF